MEIQFEFDTPVKNKVQSGLPKCECCGRLMITYKRILNSNMALVLILLLKHKQFGYTHIENFLKDKGYNRSGDFHKLIYWGFLERKHEEREDGSPRNGYYKITGRGIMFTENKTTAKEKALIYNNKFLGFEGKEITIIDAIRNKFNYMELMQTIN